MSPDKGRNPTLLSMRAVTRMTGLSADTIRKWEARYGAVRPLRTKGNTRKYKPDQVRRLSLLHELTVRGHHIKDIAGLGDPQLESLIEQSTHAGPAPSPAGNADCNLAWQRTREDYLHAVRAFDGHRAAGLLARAAALLDPVDFVHHMALPLLQQVGLLWSEGETSPAHEHLATAQLRAVLTASLRWFAPQPGACKVVVTTPAGHAHEMGALMGALLAANRGLDPIYLGPDLPVRDIEIALDLGRAGLLVLGVARSMDKSELDLLADDLRSLSNRVETWVGLPEGHDLLGRKTKARCFTNFVDYDMALTQFASCGHR